MENRWYISRLSDGPHGSTVVEHVVVCSGLEYHGEWMGDEYITVDVKSPIPVDFHLGDFVEYRGESYSINYDPSVLKKARRGTYGEGFTYSGIKLYPASYELRRCGFKDIVLEDNNIPYTSLSTFSFFCSSVEDFADRLQANLDRAHYSWFVLTPDRTRSQQRCYADDWEDYYDGDEERGEQDVNISIDKQTCWSAMKCVYEQFGLSWMTIGNTLIIGGKPIKCDKIFRYGKGNGLYEIERTSDPDDELVTKAYGYGSTQNLPLNYYAYLGTIPRLIIGNGQAHEVDHYIYRFQVNLFDDLSPYLTGTPISTTRDTSHAPLHLFSDTCRPLYLSSTPDGPGVYCEYSKNEKATNVEGYYTTKGVLAVYDEAMWDYLHLTLSQPLYIVGGVDKQAWNGANQDVYRIDTGTPYPTLLSINKLMLPGFPLKSLDAWLRDVVAGDEDGDGLSASDAQALLDKYLFSTDAMDPWVRSQNSDVIGDYEGVANFDGNGLTEILPTLNEATTTVDGSTVRIDAIVHSERISDNGALRLDENASTPTFTIRVYGGDVEWGYQDGDVTLSMKSGYCVGRDFKVQRVSSNPPYVDLTLERSYDQSVDRYFPNDWFGDGQSDAYQILGSEEKDGDLGDTFVATGLPMPASLIRAASVKLLIAVCGWLDKRDHVRYTYIPRIDEIYMARQDESYRKGDDNVSYHDFLHAGQKLQFEDSDLGIELFGNASLFIDQLSIREDGNNGIPTYDVVLREEKEKGTLDKLTEQVTELTKPTVDVTERQRRTLEYIEYDSWTEGKSYYFETLNIEYDRLETSRVWHYDALWECRRSFTSEEPTLGCSDWVLLRMPAVVYTILPSENAIHVVRTDTGYASPTGGKFVSLRAGYKRSEGNVITMVEDATEQFSGQTIYFRRHLRSTGEWETYYYSYANATNRRALVVVPDAATSGLNVDMYDMVEFSISSSTASVGTEMEDVKDRMTVPVIADGADGADGASASFFWLRTSTSGVTVNADGTTTPTTFKVSIMKTEGGATTELTSWPTDLPNGLALEIYKDGTLYYSENSLSEWSSVMEGLRTGIPTSDFANASFFEFRLRAQRTTDVYDTKSINSVKPGAPAEFYSLEIQGGISSVDFSANFAGIITARPSQVTLLLRHVVGNTQEYLSDVPAGMTLEHLLDNDTWETTFLGIRSTEDDLSDGTYDTAYRLMRGSTVISTVSLSSHWSYQRMLLPAGRWDATKTYERTPTTTPLVLYAREDGGDDCYYFLDADRAQGSSGQNKPAMSGSYWQLANEYDVVLTKMLFAQFAQLGGYIVYDKYFFSRFGTLVAADGSETVIDNETAALTDVTGQKGGSSFTAIPYGWFDPSDPMPSGTHSPSTSYKFRPMKCINAMSGEEWASGGNVHFSDNGDVDINGTIRTANLYRSVALCWGQVDAVGGVKTCTLEPGGTTKTYLYVKSLKNEDSPALAAKYGFKPGDYFEYTSEMKNSADADGFDGGMAWSDINDNDFVPCTYSADLVELLDNTERGAFYPYEGTVYLPLPQTFLGKRIEVRHNNTEGTARALVKTVDPTQNYFMLCPELDGHGDLKPSGDTTSSSVTMLAGQTAFFYSVGTYWLYFPSGGGERDINERCKGLYLTAAKLSGAQPSPRVGDWAYVGNGFPATIYVCEVAGTWTNSGQTYDGGSVSLTDYATKAYVHGRFRLLSEADYEQIEQQGLTDDTILYMTPEE